jgi:hypothetical protein
MNFIRSGWLGPVAMLTIAGMFLAPSLAAPAGGGKVQFEVKAEAMTGAAYLSVTGDTLLNESTPSNPDHCEGAKISTLNNRGFYTHFRDCMDDIMLGDTLLNRGGMSAFQDDVTGNVTSVIFQFLDGLDNQYRTDRIELLVPQPVDPNALTFTIEVNVDGLHVRPFKGGKKDSIGQVSLGTFVYTRK